MFPTLPRQHPDQRITPKAAETEVKYEARRDTQRLRDVGAEACQSKQH